MAPCSTLGFLSKKTRARERLAGVADLDASVLILVDAAALAPERERLAARLD
jgi:hypothetical protein